MTKQGTYGTLYRFRVEYTNDPQDGTDPIFAWDTWAYDEEHAIDAFYDAGATEEGWEALRVRRIRSVA